MDQNMLALVNTVVCGAVMEVCIRRLAMCHSGIAVLVRLKYTLLLGGGMAHGFQPFLFGEFPTIGGFVLSIGVFIGLLCSAHRWRKHPPVETETRPSALA